MVYMWVGSEPGSKKREQAAISKAMAEELEQATGCDIVFIRSVRTEEIFRYPY
jgi:hypothetical protein